MLSDEHGRRLITRTTFFANGAYSDVALSPDGSLISYSRLSKGASRLWIGPSDDPASAKQMDANIWAGSSGAFEWAYTNHHLLFFKDTGGDENSHLYCFDVRTGNLRDLTPVPGAQARSLRLDRRYWREAYVELNERDPESFDLYRIDLNLGKRELLWENTGDVHFLPGSYGAFSFAVDYEEAYANLTEHEGGWLELPPVPLDDPWFDARVLSVSSKLIFASTRRGHDTLALVSIDRAGGAVTTLAEDERVDLNSAVFDTKSFEPIAAAFDRDPVRWVVLDPEYQVDFDLLAQVDPGSMRLIARSTDERLWLVSFSDGERPERYYLWNRETRITTFLFANFEELKDIPLARVQPVQIPARDGRTLFGYLTLPPDSLAAGSGRPSTPLPMVLDVHGGPLSRESWTFNSERQLLANRGYAVLAVNYRGSTGFGKDYARAGLGQFGAGIQEDLIDSVEWAIAQGIAARGRIAIMGSSFGGYATLSALASGTDLFACGIAFCGPTDLVAFLDEIPAYWQPFQERLWKVWADPSTEEGRRVLEERSPLRAVDRIKAPLLVGHTVRDARVKLSQSERLVEALKARHAPVTFAVFDNMGHTGLGAYRIAWYAIVESFLAQHLGGSRQPLTETELSWSGVRVPVGADRIPGLRRALD